VTVSDRGSFGELLVESDNPQRWLLPSTTEMVALDTATIDSGVPSLELMERAGGAVATRLRSSYPNALRYVVLCGPGNNGGDGLVVSRHLREQGCSVCAVVAASNRYSDDCATQLRHVGEVSFFGGLPGGAGLRQSSYLQLDEGTVRAQCAGAEVIVDALLGSGQRAAPRGVVGTLVSILNDARRLEGVRVVSVDIPTGVDADTGGVFDPHVDADLTLCIEFIKRGLVQFPARDVCGVIEALPIGISASLPVEFSAVEGIRIPALKPRRPDAHKGDFGRILVIGGSIGMPGAALLAALGALRSGAGIVSRVVKRGWDHAASLPECMFELLEGEEDFFTIGDVDAIVRRVSSFDVLVIGPGIGRAPETGEFLRALVERLKELGVFIIFDADAINLIAEKGIDLRGCPAIITPHPGEAARLLGVRTDDIQSDRFSAARELWSRYGSVVVLKGAGTIVYSDDQGRVVSRGSPYLATPGSGDVLAGIIGALCIRSGSAFDAATLGAWVHAAAGIEAATQMNGSIMASDVARIVPSILSCVEQR
jgi:hydroxyethylthiazole kinase-like uncharacterized protein yjeF